MAKINPEGVTVYPRRLHAFLVWFGAPVIPFSIGINRILVPQIATFLPTLFMGA
jgi:hypothetical protein